MYIVLPKPIVFLLSQQLYLQKKHYTTVHALLAVSVLTCPGIQTDIYTKT